MRGFQGKDFLIPEESRALSGYQGARYQGRLLCKMVVLKCTGSVILIASGDFTLNLSPVFKGDIFNSHSKHKSVRIR